MLKVYLAGGMRTEWRERVKGACPALHFIDPAEKEGGGEWNAREYVAWDLLHVRQADVVFGYMEHTNPSGIGLACEIGYAKALGKTVVVVIEPNNQHREDHYFHFMGEAADADFSDLDSGVAFLQRLQ